MSSINLFNESGVEILVRGDGYINATTLCKQAGKGFNDWKKIRATFEFLKALSSEMNIFVSDLVQVKKGGSPQEQGTWVHQLVAINLAVQS